MKDSRQGRSRSRRIPGALWALLLPGCGNGGLFIHVALSGVAAPVTKVEASIALNGAQSQAYVPTNPAHFSFELPGGRVGTAQVSVSGLDSSGCTVTKGSAEVPVQGAGDVALDIALSNLLCTHDTDCCGGYVCNGGTCRVRTESKMIWNFTDSCNNGQGDIQVRVFDSKTRIGTGTLGLSYGDMKIFTVTCTTGDQQCYGARQTGGYWGVDIDDSKNCSSCCSNCATGSITVPPLTCN